MGVRERAPKKEIVKPAISTGYEVLKPKVISAFELAKEGVIKLRQVHLNHVYSKWAFEGFERDEPVRTNMIFKWPEKTTFMGTHLNQTLEYGDFPIEDTDGGMAMEGLILTRFFDDPDGIGVTDKICAQRDDDQQWHVLRSRIWTGERSLEAQHAGNDPLNFTEIGLIIEGLEKSRLG